MVSQTKIYEVFHPIYGIEVDAPAPIVIGDFTFYQFPRDQYGALKKHFLDLNNSNGEIDFLFSSFKNTSAAVGVNVEAIDQEEAELKAERLFIQLTNIFYFRLFKFHDRYRVSVFDSLPISVSPYITISNFNDMGIKGKRHIIISGARGRIEISKLIQEDKGVCSGLIKKLTKNPLTKMERRLLLSVDFCGLAIKELGQPSSYVQAVTSLECLFSMNNHGISQSIADYYALIMGRDLNERINLRDKIKELYKMRSKLAHGEDSFVDKEKCIEAICYVRDAIFAFITKKELLALKNEKDFMNYIDSLKFRD